MKLIELTNQLQNLCHDGYSNENVVIFLDPFDIPIDCVKRVIRTSANKDNKGVIILKGVETC